MRRVLLGTFFILFAFASLAFAQPFSFDFFSFDSVTFDPFTMMRNGSPVAVGALVQVIKPGTGNILHRPDTVGTYGATTNGDVVVATFAIGDGVDPLALDPRGVFSATLTGIASSTQNNVLISGNPFYIRVWATVPHTSSPPFAANSPFADGGPYYVPVGPIPVTNVQLNPSSANPLWSGSTANPAIQVQQGQSTLSYNSPLAFGSATVGNSQTVTITITNTGQADLLVSNFFSTGDFVAGNANMHLHPGDLGSVSITFTPTATGTRTGTLTFSHNATATTNPFVLNLSGTGSPLPNSAMVLLNGSSVVSSNDTINFGPAQTGTTVSLSFSITDPGSNATVLSGFTASGDYTTNNPGSSVNAGASKTWTLMFSPVATGMRYGDASFQHNGVNNASPFVLHLKGSGSAVPQPWSGGNSHVASNPNPGQTWIPPIPPDPNTNNNPPFGLQFTASYGTQPTQITLSYSSTPPAALPPTFPTPGGNGTFHADSTVHRYWDILQSGGVGFDAALDLYFTDNDIPSGFNPLSPNVSALSYNTVDHTWSLWLPIVTLFQAGTPNVYRARVFNVGGFSIWELTDQHSMPVSALQLSASAGDGKVALRWHVETEIENQYYIIERRAVGRSVDWTTIHDVPSLALNGTSATPLDYSYTDFTAQNGIEYQYRISDMSLDGIQTVRATVRARPTAPIIHDYALTTYPNPFNPDLKITFTMKSEAKVNLTVINIMGQTVAKLVDGEVKHAGTYTVRWNATRNPSGIYFLKFDSDDFSTMRKVVFEK